MFSDTEPEQEPNQPLFISFEERTATTSSTNSTTNKTNN